MFIIHWQTSGSIKFIKDNILISSTDKHITWLKLKKTCRIILTIVVCNVTVLVVNLVYNWTTFFRTRPIIVIMEFGFLRDVFHSIYSLYGPYAWHISLCIFIVTVKSLELELREFNTNFKKILDSHALTLFTDVFNEAQITQNKLTRALLNKYVEHRKLAEKVTKVDEIFKFYVLVMLITGGAHTIFTVLSTIRQKGWIHMVFFAYDIFLCVWHLLGLCIIPAQVYREV
ncbi:hypothetical protein Ddc_00162 [Ditylenchus destructor]|nr:hypothetical protein Ddc_00162 [Ditylenchus destructor]